MTEGIRILCVDDHRLVREGIAKILENQCDISVVAFASDGEEGYQAFVQHQPDVTLMDLLMPGMNGLDCLRRIREHSPGARVIMLTMYHGEEDVYKAVRGGAAGYLLKDSLPDDLVRVVREVHAGASALPPQIATQLAKRVNRNALTEREEQVIQLVARGMRNKEVGAVLGIAEDTVQVYLKRIFEKLKVHDRLAAVTVAVERGIVHRS
jgi:DNA-binding NarL/FixJ family response regulator